MQNDYSPLGASLEKVIRFYQALGRGEIGVCYSKRTLGFYHLFISRFPPGWTTEEVRQALQQNRYADKNDIGQFLAETILRYQSRYMPRGKQLKTFPEVMHLMLAYNLRDYLAPQLVDQLHEIPISSEGVLSVEEKPLLVTLSPEWVISRNSLFGKSLRPYEKYILYLHFAENMSVRQIAKKLEVRGRWEVGDGMQRSLGKLKKELWDEGQAIVIRPVC